MISTEQLLTDRRAFGITLRHPSGRSIEIACVAGSRAGGGLVSRWSAGVIFDEAPRMVGADDAVVNLDHARSAVLGRLLPGAQALYIGGPWAPFGPIYELTQEHWGKPSEHPVVFCGTGPMLNALWWTPERCERLQRQDPTVAACRATRARGTRCRSRSRRPRSDAIQLSPDPTFCDEMRAVVESLDLGIAEGAYNSRDG